MTGQSLQLWRERLGYSKAHAARELGIGRIAYAKYELATSVPKVVALAAAAVAFGLPPMA